MRYRILLVALIGVISGGAFAQQNPIFSYYMLNKAVFNPAYHGLAEEANVTAGHRSQWFGYGTSFDGSGGAPYSQSLTLSIPVKGKISGLGFNMVNDNIGPVNTMRFQPAATFTQSFRKGSFTIGLAPTVIMQTLNFNRLRFVDESDPLNNGTKQSQVQADLDVGISYHTDDYDISVGLQNVLEPSFNFGIDDLDNNITRSLVFSASYTYNPIYKFEFTPSIFVRSDFLTSTFDASLMVTYDKRMWGGLSYRYAESAIILLGYSFLEENQLKLGYSFDYIISNQDAKQPTSHEILIRYNLPSLNFGGKKIIRTPRFIF